MVEFLHYKIEKMDRELEFHKSRIAFLVMDNEILYLENSPMSHKEWYLSLGYKEENFNHVIRGYLKDNKLVYYKGDFMYDDEVIQKALETEDIIKKHCDKLNAITYCGVIKGEVGEDWPPKEKLIDLI